MQDRRIRGLSIHQQNYKILQFADDAIIIANDLNDVNLILRILKNFGECSGININIDKSELVKLGVNNKETGTYLHRVKMK